MNVQRDPDAILAEWLEEGPTVLPEPTRRAIAVVTRTTNQTRRPIWMPLRRPSMNPYARIAVVATVLVLLVGGALYALTPTNNGVGGPPGSPALSTPASSPTPASSSAAPSSTAFTSAAFKIPIGFTLSDGWSIATDEQGEVSLEHGAAVAAIMSLDSMTVRGATSTAPWVPWPDDVHAWLAGRPEFSPTAARAGVVGGRRGHRRRGLRPGEDHRPRRLAQVRDGSLGRLQHEGLRAWERPPRRGQDGPEVRARGDDGWPDRHLRRGKRLTRSNPWDLDLPLGPPALPQSGNASGPRSLSSRASPEASSAGSHEYG